VEVYVQVYVTGMTSGRPAASVYRTLSVYKGPGLCVLN